LHGTAVRTRDWRYVEFGENAVNGVMLFDEHRDPNELKNLADEPTYAKVRVQLSEQIKKYGARDLM
jgi:arylsulfatase A-like enzyme